MAKRHYVVLEDFMLDDESLSTNEMLVYAIIYGFSMSDECAYTGRVQYIADTLHISLKTVRRVLKSLEDKGYIEQQNSNLSGAYSQCKAYRAVMERVDKLTSLGGQIDQGRVDKLTSLGGQIDQSIYIDIQEKNNDIDIQDKESTERNKFTVFYEAYPKKRAKQDAEKAFAKLNPSNELFGEMMAALEKQKQSKQWKEDGGRYVPNPATWLNGRRWEDELTDGQNVSTDHIKGEANYDMDAIKQNAKKIVKFSL